MFRHLLWRPRWWTECWAGNCNPGLVPVGRGLSKRRSVLAVEDMVVDERGSFADGMGGDRWQWQATRKE
jgi:hypothetical protein